jgi:beta-galactosidase/beta-glucuronidase
MKFDKRACALTDDVKTPIVAPKEMSTKEELYKEIDNLRKKYAPFLQNHAPKLENTRVRTDIKEFILDGKEKVTIPHYDGPVGNATKIYEADFELGAFDDKAVYICFKGADYIAKVYVNNECVGMHEGFFSPFEFNITSVAKKGVNHLKVVLENDFVYRGDTIKSIMGGVLGLPDIEGDKLYAATGLGYDDPEVGWHHCPPGMGLWNDVYVEVRNKINITDLYVRPILSENSAELWVEIENVEHEKRKVNFNLSLYGRNFEKVFFENLEYSPVSDGHELYASYGKNVYKIRIPLEEVKLWNIETPYLYQLNVSATIDNEV